MKKTTLEMQWSEERRAWAWTTLMSTALIWALSLFSPSEWLAQTRSSADEGEKVEVVTTQWTNVEEKKDTITLDEAIQLIKNEWIEEVEEDGTWIEPDPEWDDEWKTDQLKTPTKFTISTWVGYKVWWDVQWVNRIQWSWEMLQSTPFSTRITWIVDLDNPMYSKWSWKLILWKTIYKWISLDWDYTFTGTWWNLFRFGFGYTWQLWKWVYGIKIFPLNTNWSPISVKAMVSTKVWKNWEFSSFVLLDFGQQSYYWETEYSQKIVQKIVEWVALFVQARYWWKLDGRFWEWDSQSILWGVRFDIK